MDYETAVLGASLRCRARRERRRAHGLALARLLSGGDVDIAAIEPLARQLERARLLGRTDLAQGLGLDPSASRKLFEAVIETDDMLPRRFLTLGEAAARAVGRIVVHGADGATKYGTGALVRKDLILTNNHVLEAPTVAAAAVFELGYHQVDHDAPPVGAQAFAVQPDAFFFTDEELDFTLVGVAVANATATTADYGFLPLIAASGKALIGEKVNIIQHAGGLPQTISIRANQLVDVVDQWLHYTTDTAPGSSGAPVFNDDWQLIGLHHAAVASESADGRPGVVNEGIRASAILGRLNEVFG